jgi:hypothetical protein
VKTPSSAVIHRPRPLLGGYWKYLFSSAKLLISDIRNSLGDNIIEASECLKSWIQQSLIFGATGSSIVRIEQMLKDLVS